MSARKLTRKMDVRAYRDGQAQDFLDTVKTIMSLRNTIFDDCKTEIDFELAENKYRNELGRAIEELHSWDITNIGDLYWTSGGRIVLDKGYGEYFNDSDKKLFTLEELTRGMDAEKFIAKLQEAKKGRRMKY